MIRATRVALAAVAALLAAACGGTDEGLKPAINSMVATPTSYGRTTLWTLSGQNLDQPITFFITSGACDNLAEVAGGTAFQRQYSCRAATVGDIEAQVNQGGTRLASLRVIIPQPQVQFVLAQGTITVALYPQNAPITVQNFLNYVNTGFYNNTIFHRVIEDFVIQGGAYAPGNPDPVFKPPTQPPIVLESNNGLSNTRGTIAMARTSEPNSANSQFYFNVVDNLELDYRSPEAPGYAVFGMVTSGLNVVDAISVVPTYAIPGMGLFNLPVTNVIVTTARQVR